MTDQQTIPRTILLSAVSNVAVLVSFFVLLAVGFNLSARPFFEAISKGPFLYSAWNLFFGSICFAPGNIAILSVLCAYLGAELNSETISYSTQWRQATARGVLVFVITLAAIGWMDMEKILAADQEMYFKLALAVMGLSFVIGFDPTRIGTLLNKKEKQ